MSPADRRVASLIQREALEIEVCRTLMPEPCGRCMWCGVRRMLGELGLADDSPR